ncbi:MAG: alpha/beta hydrolase-fold protein, partial [Gammaproteobacteria bacterium]
ERMIDYAYGIDDYVKFIDKSLLPTLKESGLDLPTNPNNRVMIGSSLSGTASIYIGTKYPKLVGGVIAQSPSPANRKILKDIVDNYEPSMPRAYIQLSCGEFEQPGFAENTNLPFAKELSEIFQIPLSIGAYGHQHLAWMDELTHSLPATLATMKENNCLIKPKC